MINQIIPIVEFGVKNDPSGEFLTVPVGDFPACFIDFVDNAGEDLESGFGHGFCRPVAGIRHRNQRCSAPESGYVGEEPVFDGVVLGAVRRIVHHDYLDPDSLRKPHEVLFHDVVGTGVGSAAVAEYDKHPGVGVGLAQMPVPTVLYVVADKLGGVVAGAYGKVSGVVRDIINAMWDNGSVREGGEVVVERFGRRRAEDGPLSLEVADKLLLLRVNAYDRDVVFGTHLPDHVDFLKLLVPALNFAHGNVFSERPRFKAALADKLSDDVVGDVNVPFMEFPSYSRSFDVEPHDAFVLRVSRHMLGNHLKECLFPFRMCVGFLLRTASRLADSVAFKACFFTKFTDSFDNRSCGDSQKRAQRSYCATSVPDRFACNKMPSVAFIKRFKECHIFLCNVYWRFLLHICNILFFNYKYTKKSPIICCLTTKKCYFF